MGAAGIILVCFIISAIIQKVLLGRFIKRFKIQSGVAYSISQVLHYLILLVGIMLAIEFIGFSLASLLVIFGFLSVGIGFGLQNVTSNFISGLIILFERPISVGDFITVDDLSGTVVAIKMRSSIINTRDAISIIVPNSQLIQNKVVNWSHGGTDIRLHAQVGVAYGTDERKVVETLMSVANKHPEVLKRPAPEVRLLGFGDSALNFDLLIWTDHPENQFLIHSQINFMILEAFREKDIRIPFPQRDLHLQMSPAIEKLSKDPS